MRFFSIHPACRSRLLLASLFLLLTGCAGELAHREGLSLLSEGRPEDALAALEKATKESPSNLEFKAHYLNARDGVIGRLLANAQAERNAGRLDEAENYYKRVLRIDAGNANARAGIEAIEQARRHAKLLQEAGALIAARDFGAAELKIAQVLQANPRHAEARALQRQIEDASGRGMIVPAALRQTFKRPVTLEFRDANLKQVVEALSRHSGLNFVLDKDIQPTLQTTVFLRQVSVEDALDVILTTHQLARRIVNDNTLLIYPNTAAKQSEHQELVVKAFYLANTDAKQAMSLLKTVLKVKNLHVDEKLNLLVMRDTPEAVRLAERLIAMQDVREPEVMLEVEVIEVKRSRLMELGIRFPDQLKLTPLPSSGTAVTLRDVKNLNSAGLGASLSDTIVNLKREVGDTNILANPRIRSRNREKALIKIGDRVPVITTTSTSTGFVSENVQYVDVGLKLEVEPSIFPDNEVAIKVQLEVSSVVKEVVSKAGSLSYQIGSRNAATVVRLKDGETQILGGLITDEERQTANRVPGLGDLPVIGRLFSSQKDDNQKTELVLSITPRLIHGVGPPSHVPSEFWSGTEANLRMKPLAVASTAPVAGVAPLPAGAAAPAGSAVAVPAAVLTQEAKGEPVMLRWDGNSQAKVGETLSLSLMASVPQEIVGLPLQIKYDPAVLEPVELKPGSLMAQGEAKTEFTQRVVPASGMVFVTQNRMERGGAKGEGVLMTVAFKALKPAERSVVTVLPATPIGKDKAPQRQTGPALLGVIVTP
jgi:general secretion pathway protein D